MVGWKSKSIGELFSISGGLSASRAQLSNKGYFYLHYGDIHAATKTYVDTDKDRYTIPRLDISLNKVSPATLLSDGDVVFVDASEDDEGASRHLVVRNRNQVPFIAGLHTIVAKSITSEICNLYKEYCFQTENVKKQFRYYAAGTKVTGVSKNNLRKITIEYPENKTEQNAIAEALSDVDRLIESLGKLIEKKKAIKQGAIQELLTGRKRLLRFTREWEVKKVKEFGEIVTGGTPSTFIKEFWNGRIPWVTPTDISNRKEIYDTERKITELGLNRLRKLPAGSVLVTCIASIGKNAILKIAGACNQQINAIIPYSDYDSDFLYYLFEINKKYLLDNAGITATNIISKKDFSELEFKVPKLEEQQAIAHILSDMDSEIEALGQKLEKYKTIKQGMMQELLTGRIRLVNIEDKAKTQTVPFTVAKKEQFRRGHNRHFEDAVLIAAIVDAFYSDKYPLGRVKIQKLLYLVRRKQEASVAEFKKKAAGPYADEIRYKGGEPIAKANKYIVTSTSEKGTRYGKGEYIAQALGYIEKWNMQSCIDWLKDNFLHRSRNELELLATIDMAICDLSAQGKEISVANIKELIRSDKEWNAKLKKAFFSDIDIHRAIKEIARLFG